MPGFSQRKRWLLLPTASGALAARQDRREHIIESSLVDIFASAADQRCAISRCYLTQPINKNLLSSQVAKAAVYAF